MTRSLRRLALLALLALPAAAAAACGGAAPPPRAAEGAACDAGEDCAAGLVCKAARCAPPRSPAGGVCVTDAGCGSGLACVSGTCSEGVADAARCEVACARVRELMGAEVDREGGGPAGATGEALLRASLIDVELQCREACTGRASRERADCLAAAASLDALEACP